MVDSPQIRVPPGAAESHKSELAFERLLADLSARFVDVSGDAVEAEIELAQKQLIAFLGCDRSTFAEFDADGGGQILCSAAIDGIEPFPRGPTPPFLDWYLSEVLAGRTIITRGADDLPPEAVRAAEVFRASGLRSQLTVPLRVGGRIVGAIAFGAFRASRDWDADLIARIKLLGEVFAQALARKRAVEALAAALTEIRQLKERLEHENAYLRDQAQVRSPGGLVSRSPRFKAVLDELAQVAPTGATVLLLGETGSGKEVLAHALHEASARAKRPLVKVNCAALPATLIEAELFGREKGVYTGALARQMGRFELANGSTILLDEIGEMPLELQPKLLRVLQDGSFERVGGVQTIKVDVRIIAATNRNLERAIIEGRFREDLFYRLNVFPITVPPLRERSEDIPLLAWNFAREFGKAMGKPIERIADDSLEAMLSYAWPGNVRELRNVIEHAMILARSSTLEPLLGLRTQPPPLKHGTNPLRGRALRAGADDVGR